MKACGAGASLAVTSSIASVGMLRHLVRRRLLAGTRSPVASVAAHCNPADFGGAQWAVTGQCVGASVVVISSMLRSIDSVGDAVARAQ